MKTLSCFSALLLILGLTSCAAINDFYHPGAASTLDGGQPQYEQYSTRLAVIYNQHSQKLWTDILLARSVLDENPSTEDFSKLQIKKWVEEHTDFMRLDSFNRAEFESQYMDEMAKRMLNEALAIDNTVFAIPGRARFDEYNTSSKAYPVTSFGTDTSFRRRELIRHLITYYDQMTQKLMLAGNVNYGGVQVALSNNALYELGIHDSTRARSYKPDLYNQAQDFVIVSEFVNWSPLKEQHIFNGLCWAVNAPRNDRVLIIPMNKDVGRAGNSAEGCKIGALYFQSKKDPAKPSINFKISEIIPPLKGDDQK